MLDRIKLIYDEQYLISLCLGIRDGSGWWQTHSCRFIIISPIFWKEPLSFSLGFDSLFSEWLIVEYRLELGCRNYF